MKRSLNVTSVIVLLAATAIILGCDQGTAVKPSQTFYYVYDVFNGPGGGSTQFGRTGWV